MALDASKKRSLLSFPSFFRSRKAATTTTASKLGFENLESRELLAADVLGYVTADLQGDGNTANDVVVVGASAALYRDGGNGVFDGAGSGDDTLVRSAALTNSEGQYRFEGIEAGNYHVQITPPAGMQFQEGEASRSFSVTADESRFAVGPVIDDFESEQRVSASPPLPSSTPSRMADSTVLGGERDLYVTVTEGSDRFSAVSLTSGDGLIRLATDTAVTGDAKIVWDGFDNSAEGVDTTGLKGVDLTQHDGNDMTGIALTVGADQGDSRVKLKIYTNDGRWSEYETVVPATEGGAATKYLVFGFEDEPSTESGGGADFSNVGAIELTFEGVSAVDGQVALVGLVGKTVKQVDFVAEPRLSLGDQVWYDQDNNGRFDAGERGVPNVQVNLFEDVNRDNTYTAGVDALMATTETDGDGRYKFTDLFPGDYLVQVAEQNFSGPGPLNGLVSSTGNDPASDPDDNVNSDDNGSAVAGLGVLSQAVSLAGGAEPTNDGDDANCNATVDFGFYGFDLVLDKDVNTGDGAQVKPEDRLTYTVTIVNEGPSTALNAQFEDTLAPNTQFVSASSSTGAAINHSNGRLTASLGDLTASQVVKITVVVDVNANATGSLTNTATVSAPNEVNLSNNTDSVTNRVDPVIDLTIRKSDSDDPVKPGETFDYILVATNNGPSDATGVVVKDELPAEVSFVSATRTPTTNSGRDLAFTVGDLGAGESSEIRVTVRVDSDFVGMLLNTAVVSGNEKESNYQNNEDDEPTEVLPVIDLQIVKTDSDDPVAPGETFTYTIEIRNNGPSDATGVTVVDTLPATGLEYQGASVPGTQSGRDVTFEVGDLANGESRTIDIRVAVDKSFVGTLLNVAKVSGNEDETTLVNNVDDEETRVVAEPASVSGYVYVDRNNNGVFESTERPIANVTLVLSGRDFQGNTVRRETVTDSNGFYKFSDLQPGSYNITETQPERYGDGQETVGSNGDSSGSAAQGLAALDQFDAEGDVIASGIGGVELVAGADGSNYNFGELAANSSKQDYIHGLDYYSRYF